MLGRESRERTLTQPCKDKKLRSYSPRYLYPKHVIMGPPFTRVAILVPSVSLCYGQFSILQTLSLFPFSLPLASFTPRVLLFVLHDLHSFRTFRHPSSPPPSRCPSWSSHSLFLSSESKTTVYEQGISQDILRFREHRRADVSSSACLFQATPLPSTLLSKSPASSTPDKKKRTRESHFTTYPNSRTVSYPRPSETRFQPLPHGVYSFRDFDAR